MFNYPFNICQELAYRFKVKLSISHIHKILSGATTPESNDNEEVHCFLQSYKTRSSPSDGYMSFLVHSLARSLTLRQRFSRCILPLQLTGLCSKLDLLEGLHSGRPWYQQHGSGRVCHVSGYGSHSRLPSAGAGKAQHLRYAAKTVILRASRRRPLRP